MKSRIVLLLLGLAAIGILAGCGGGFYHGGHGHGYNNSSYENGYSGHGQMGRYGGHR